VVTTLVVVVVQQVVLEVSGSFNNYYYILNNFDVYVIDKMILLTRNYSHHATVSSRGSFIHHLTVSHLVRGQSQASQSVRTMSWPGEKAVFNI
jgi:hypothetical protein